MLDTAQRVRITLSDGQIVETPTFAVPADLGAVRFYATPLPAHGDISRLVGIDADGREVARLNP